VKSLKTFKFITTSAGSSNDNRQNKIM